MESWLNSPEGSTVRRLVVTFLGVAILGLNNRLGLGLDTTAQASIAGIVLAYLTQSGVVAALKAKAATEQ